MNKINELQRLIAQYETTKKFKQRQRKGEESNYHSYYRAFVDGVLKYGEMTCVLYCVGSFYECYGFIHNGEYMTNYIEVSKDANYKIAKRDIVPTYETPQYVGFPVGSIDKHIDALIRNDYTVVMYDQYPIDGSSKFERKLTRVVTPATYLEKPELYTNPLAKNTIACMFFDGITRASSTVAEYNFHCGVCVVDISDGEVIVGEFYSQEDDRKKIADEIHRFLSTYSPNEVLCVYRNLVDGEDILEYCGVNRGGKEWFSLDAPPLKKHLLRLPHSRTKTEFQQSVLSRSYPNLKKSAIFDELDITSYDMGIIAMVELCHHFAIFTSSGTGAGVCSQLRKPVHITEEDKLVLENNSAIQLSIATTTTPSSLFKVIKNTKTPMGSRMLKRRLLKPFRSADRISRLHDTVEDFVDFSKTHEEVMSNIRKTLNDIRDIPRYQRRVNLGIITTKEFVTFYESLCSITSLIKTLLKHKVVLSKTPRPPKALLKKFVDYKRHCIEIVDMEIASNLDLQSVGKDGGVTFIRGGVSEEIDEAKLTLQESLEYLEVTTQRLNDLINVNNSRKLVHDPVKLKSTEGEGHYLIITNGGYSILKEKIAKVYPHYVNDGDEKIKFVKQTSNYKAKSARIKASSEKCIEGASILRRETASVFKALLSNLSERASVIEDIANYVAEIDVSISNAMTALDFGYCKPNIIHNSGDSSVSVKEIRNPIGERMWKEKCVENDLSLSNSGMILYGVNAAGKSSCMKAVAYNIILAQSGGYCAASEFLLSPYRNIFTRVGNTDSLFYSSFEMECLDIKSILQRSTSNTFVLLDELVASTENSSALAISYATVKRLSSRGVSFIFATHLTKLSSLIDSRKVISNVSVFHLSVKVTPKGFVYLRKLQPGPCRKLYGIEIAKSIISDDEFTRDAMSVRESIEPKYSKYNANLLVKECAVCSSEENLVTHHIIHQEDGGGNEIENLCVLCEACHNSHHSGDITIHGWKKSTERGRYLEWAK